MDRTCPGEVRGQDFSKQMNPRIVQSVQARGAEKGRNEENLLFNAMRAVVSPRWLQQACSRTVAAVLDGAPNRPRVECFGLPLTTPEAHCFGRNRPGPRLKATSYRRHSSPGGLHACDACPGIQPQGAQHAVTMSVTLRSSRCLVVHSYHVACQRVVARECLLLDA